MTIIHIKEAEVETLITNSDNGCFTATVRDGEVTYLDTPYGNIDDANLKTTPQKEELQDYAKFIQEILKAVKETS